MSTPTPKNLQLFFERLRKARVDKGLRQEEIAANLRIALSTNNNWERGVNLPRIDVIEKLSRLLDCPLEWLLTGREQGVIWPVRAGPGPPPPPARHARGF